MKLSRGRAGAIIALVLMGGAIGQGSSHREAPGITKTPKLDGTDFYMFRSYEPGRSGYVTLVANYIPLQDPYGGPNYFSLDPAAVYEIHIDNDGDAIEDLTFQFRPQEIVKDLSVPVGDLMVPVPLINIGPIGPGVDDVGALNRRETLQRQPDSRRPPQGLCARHQEQRRRIDLVPQAGRQHRHEVDPALRAYANNHIYDIEIPGCDDGQDVRRPAQGFVRGQPRRDVRPGQRQQPARSPRTPKPTTSPTRTSPRSSSRCRSPASSRRRSSRSSAAGRPRASTSARSTTFGLTAVRATGQVSRLGMPLVNEVVIGLRGQGPLQRGRAEAATRRSPPTSPIRRCRSCSRSCSAAPACGAEQLPAHRSRGRVPHRHPGPQQAGQRRASEMLRLNTAIAPTPLGSQNSLGVLGGDNAGFPNGRRPGDDVVDIELRVAMGVLCHAFPGAFAAVRPTHRPGCCRSLTARSSMRRSSTARSRT